MPPKPRSKPKKNTVEIIKELSNKKGVTILLDVKGNSNEAQIESPYSYSGREKTLLIVAPLLAEIDKELLNQIIRKVFDDGRLILLGGTEKVLESYREYSSNNKDNRILEFFAGTLSESDFTALKMSLYLRDQMSKRANNIFKLKQDIRDKFGERGANIANLCTAGYFENYFMPLFNQLKKQDFYDEYEIAVGIKAKALFVHSSMSIEEIEDEFSSMVDKALKYHIKEFAIHGLGSRNVALIKDFVNAQTANEENNFIIKKRRETHVPVSIEYRVTMISPKASES